MQNQKIKEYQTRAEENFDNGMHCAQAVLCALGDLVGLDGDTAIRIATGFGSGMKHGEVCGAVSGAIMAIGYKFGKADVTDRDNLNMAYDKVNQFIARFQTTNGSTICKVLIGYDLSVEQELLVARESGIFNTKCKALVKDAVAAAIPIILG